MLRTMRCKQCGADYTGGRCEHCGSDEFVDVEGMYNPENFQGYRSEHMFFYDTSRRNLRARVL